MAFATKTKVSVEKTRVEIEMLLRKRGASKIAVFTEIVSAAIVFEMKDRRIKFVMKIPTGEQNARSRWRALLLCIKAKLETVESGIETFEEAFLAHVMTPDGTVYEQVRPRLEQIAKTGTMVPLLPGPSQ